MIPPCDQLSISHKEDTTHKFAKDSCILRATCSFASQSFLSLDTISTCTHSPFQKLLGLWCLCSMFPGKLKINPVFHNDSSPRCIIAERRVFWLAGCTSVLRHAFASGSIRSQVCWTRAPLGSSIDKEQKLHLACVAKNCFPAKYLRNAGVSAQGDIWWNQLISVWRHCKFLVIGINPGMKISTNTRNQIMKSWSQVDSLTGAFLLIKKTTTPISNQARNLTHERQEYDFQWTSN